MAAGIVTAAGAVGIALTPPSVRALPSCSSPCTASASPRSRTSSSPCRPTPWPYGEWETGVRTEGSNYAVLSFSRKVGQGIGGAIAAFGIGVGGYLAGAPTQPPEALDAIRYLTGWGPALFVGIGAAIMLAYPLTEERFREVVRQIALRRADRAGARDRLPGSEA